MADFDVEHAMGLMAGADELSEMEAQMAFQATRTYLKRHGKSFMHLFGAKHSAQVIDMQLQPRVDELETENSALKERLEVSEKSLRRETASRQNLQATLLLTRTKKYLAASLMSAFVGAAGVGALWGVNHAHEYLSIKGDLENEYDKKESKRKAEHQDLVRSLNKREERLGEDFKKKDTELRSQLEREKNEFFDLTKKQFNATLRATQPFRLGTGRHGFYNPTFTNDFGVIYVEAPNKGGNNYSPALAKVAKESCIIVTGLAGNNEDWIAVTQVIEGKRVSGYMELKGVYIGPVGPKIDCRADRALIAPQPATPQ